MKEEINGDTPVKMIGVRDAAKYFAGKNSHHNHPSVFAWGKGIIVTVGEEVREFEFYRISEALEFYKAALKKMNYAGGMP